MSKDEIIRLLSRVPLFSELKRPALEMICKAVIQKTYREGEVVFLEGERCKGLYIVHSGWAQAVKIAPDGREQVIRIVGPGDVFNEVGVLTGDLNVVTVEALERLEILIVQKEAMLDFLDQYQTLAKTLIRNLAGRVLYAMNLVVDLSLHTVECRLARYLLQEAESGYINRQKWATQAVIAARIGTVPVVVNRAFRSFVENELIRMERDHIMIRDPAKLMNIAALPMVEQESGVVLVRK